MPILPSEPVQQQKQRPKMKKPKKQSQDKQKAFMSFLQAPTTSDSILLQSQKKNASDNQNQTQTYEQFVEDTNQCYICRDILDAVKKKKCGFCDMQTCDKHLRKRRRKNKKYQRICDYCEDKTLFESYMKLELKAEEALTTQEEIVGIKYSQFYKEVQKQRERRKDLIFKAQAIKSQFTDKQTLLQKIQQQHLFKQRQHQKQKSQLRHLELFVSRLSNSMRENYEEDYRILLIENEKLGKDLLNLDKRKGEIQKVIEKREKEIEKAYEQWEKKEYLKNLEEQNRAALSSKKKDCLIY